MRTEWRFNGSAQLILIPENARDKQMMMLAFDGRPELRIKPTTGDEVIIEANAPKPVERDPRWCYVCDLPVDDCACYVPPLEKQSA